MYFVSRCVDAGRVVGVLSVVVVVACKLFNIFFFVLFGRRDFGGFVLCDGAVNDPGGTILGLFEVVRVLCPNGLL